MENKPIIRINNVSKAFAHEKTKNKSSDKNIKDVTDEFPMGRKNLFFALDNVNFDAMEGERIGIIGFNGAGKTTLLNIIAGFLEPTEGKVEVNGKVNAVMSLGSVTREELTGIENIYVTGELHGYSKAEIAQYIPEISAFADIGEYIGKPVRTYSTGMKARLSFAMLSFIDPEILIIDEVLGVGDADFAQKSAKRLQEICEKGKVLIIVSHSMGSILSLTDRTVWLHNGRIRMDGPSKEVVSCYIKEVNKLQEEAELNRRNKLKEENLIDSRVEIGAVETFNKELFKKTIFEVYEDVIIKVPMDFHDNVEQVGIYLDIYKTDGALLLRDYMNEEELMDMKIGSVEVECVIDDIRFSEGIYEVMINVFQFSHDNIIAKKGFYIKLDDFNRNYSSKPDYLCKYIIEVGE